MRSRSRPAGRRSWRSCCPKGAPFTLTEKQIVAPAPKTMKDENFGTNSMYYEKEVAFTVPVTVPKTPSGQVQIPLEVTFQACGNELCLRPFTQKCRCR